MKLEEELLEAAKFYGLTIEKHNMSNGDRFYTTSNFWDCRCTVTSSGTIQHIHPSYHKRCQSCGMEKYDAPDARLNEVIDLLEWILKEHGFNV